MKKLLSIVLTLMMTVSCFAAFAITASAVNGEWNVYASRGDCVDEYDPNNRSVPGYEYTEDGLHMIPADYTWFTPHARFNTKDKINLREGVYLKVRIDNFTHGNDEWFGFYLNELQVDEFVSEDETGNPGMSALVRVNPQTRKIRTVQSNYTVSLTSGSKSVGSSPEAGVSWDEFDEEGRLIFTFEVKWHEDDGYTVLCNGISLDKGMMQEMTKVFDDNDGYMYVGFGLQNSNMGGTVECTILEFGTDKENASKPVGEDRQEPENKSKEIAEIAEASLVPDGEPAIRIDGYPEGSDALRKISCSGKATVLENNFVNLMANNGEASQLMQIFADVKYTTSYNVKDFPIAMAVFRNLCTCTYTDIDYDGEIDKICMCKESGKAYLLIGDIIQPSENYTTSLSVDMTEPYIDSEGNSYMYMLVDHSSLVDSGMEGRINGIRIDIKNVRGSDADRNNFDLCEIAYFRNTVEAQEYFEGLMRRYDGIEDETTGEETTAEETTAEEIEETAETTCEETPFECFPTEEESIDETTEAPEEETTQAEEIEASETFAEGGEKDETEAEAEEPKTDGGCGGMIGIGAIAVVAIAAAGLASFKKKD